MRYQGGLEEGEVGDREDCDGHDVIAQCCVLHIANHSTVQHSTHGIHPTALHELQNRDDTSMK